MNIKITTPNKEISGEFDGSEIYTDEKLNEHSEFVDAASLGGSAKCSFYATSIESFLKIHVKITLEKL